ncbi:right-handed parallel beta-helix repeat-containing protein [Microbacterium soli]|uniref:Periplasmic copper-binding protein NosD beta helix domain-containing protein n=1 Tax=Microbacterium soli TaxID=446075 RepID=A0ABP7MPS5_9MICO
MHSFRSLLGILLACVIGASALSGCAPRTDSDGVIHVPSEAGSLAQAEELAQPGDVILIAPGDYEEQLLVSTPDITIRGEDRNTTVIDAAGIRPFGIAVMADGVRVENLTVTGATFYGLLFTGLHDDTGPSAPTAAGYEPWSPADFPPLQRFLADHVTATNNGLYGIYAFNAQHGIIRDSYASGSADSGIYVGQCTECDVLVTGNVAERNAVGFENSNASDSVFVVGNRFSNNRVGLTLLSNYQEAFHPQRGNLIAGNIISDNNETQTPVQATGGFGTGIGISGGTSNLVTRNRIESNHRAGIVLTNAEDLATTGNAFIDNVLQDNASAVVNVSAERAPASSNCASPSAEDTIPSDLSAAMHSPNCEPSTAATTASPPQPSAAPDWPEAPEGISFRSVGLPQDQPNLPPSHSYGRLPDDVSLPDPARISVPDPAFLSEASGIR